jgi:Zn-dependent membrane protease YugP
VINLLSYIFCAAVLFWLLQYILLLLRLSSRKKTPFCIDDDTALKDVLSAVPCKIERVDGMLLCSFDSAKNTIRCRQSPEELDNVLDASILLHEYCHSVDYSEHKDNYRNRTVFDKLSLFTMTLSPLLFMLSIVQLIFAFNLNAIVAVTVFVLTGFCAVQYALFLAIIFSREHRVYVKTRRILRQMTHKGNKKTFAHIFNLNYALLITERLLLLSAILSVLFVTLGGIV